MTRKLASIQKVLAIEPIANADAIELAHFQGWQCVVKKGEFRAGESGVFFEIEASPPDGPRYQFIRLAKDGTVPPQPANFRLRTIRLRGVLPQGLLMPLDRFPEIPADLPAGTDLTEMFSVAKASSSARSPKVSAPPSAAGFHSRPSATAFPSRAATDRGRTIGLQERGGRWVVRG